MSGPITDPNYRDPVFEAGSVEALAAGTQAQGIQIEGSLQNIEREGKLLFDSLTPIDNAYAKLGELRLAGGPSWNTPALWVAVITGVLTQALAILTLFGKHVAFDPANPQISQVVGVVAQGVAGLVAFIYIHGFHKTQVAHQQALATRSSAQVTAHAMVNRPVPLPPIQQAQPPVIVNTGNQPPPGGPSLSEAASATIPVSG